MAVKIRSPTMTPTAVPGIIRVSTNSAGIPNAGDQQARHQDHVADVVEHQPEEGVDVAPARPGVARAGDPLQSAERFTADGFPAAGPTAALDLPCSPGCRRVGRIAGPESNEPHGLAASRNQADGEPARHFLVMCGPPDIVNFPGKGYRLGARPLAVRTRKAETGRRARDLDRCLLIRA